MENWQKGEIAVLKTCIRAIELGYTVSKPIKDVSRYDLVFEREGVFVKIQVKYGRLVDGSIRADTRKLNWNKVNKEYESTRQYTGEDCDAFVIYNAETDSLYWVPIAEGQSEIRLRVEDTKNNQMLKVKYAYNYLW